MTGDMFGAADRCRIVAFTSPGGTGRTAALVNVACVLAAAGKRVLIVDRGGQPPRAHGYLWQFQVDQVRPEVLLDVDVAAALLGAPDGRRDLVAGQYQLPMDAGDIDVLALAGGSALPPRGHGQDAVLRNRVRAAGYDYVLIDVAAGGTEPMARRLAYLCDTVVVCFQPQSGDITKAATLARAIADVVPFRLGILAVALQFDSQDPDMARRTKDRIGAAFAEIVTPAVSTDVVEVPYRPVGMVFDQAVTVLHEDADRPVPAAYTKVAAAVSAGEVERMPPVPARVRGSYRHSLGIGSLDAAPRIFLAYAADDRLWADWMQSMLSSSGARVDRLPEDDSWSAGPARVRPVVLVVPSPRLGRSATGRRAIELARRCAGASGEGEGFDLLAVELPGREIGPPFADVPRISFADGDEAIARRRLLRHFVLFDRLEAGRRAHPVYFPGTAAPPHSRSNLPPRNQRFVGRGEVLEHLRDFFLRTGERLVFPLTGPDGSGKSQIALEYAHRFTNDYDLQWWIPAGDERSVRDSLTALADEMRLPDSPDRPRAALEALRTGLRYQRWLLIYDNAAALDTLADLLPGGDAGHIIVTTRQPHPQGFAVGAADAEESVEQLRLLVPDLPTEEAATVAASVGHLPLAVRLAAAWMSESAAVMRGEAPSRAAAAAWAAAEFRARAERARSGQPAGSPSAPLAAALAVITQTLGETDLGRQAARLAQMCTWLFADGVALRLLRSGPMVRALAGAADDGEPLVLDPLEFDQVLHCGERFGLFQVNWERPAKLTMQQVVQELLRESMGAREAEARRRDVLHALAAFAPTDPEPEDARDVADFVELQRHIEVSGAAGSQDVGVRRWLVDHVNYLARTSSPEMWDFGIDFAQRVLAGWNPTSLAETSLRMRLEFQLANLRRQRGEDADTLLAWEQGLLDGQQQLLGPTHPRTLKTWRSKGADLRWLGRFAEACAAEQRTLHGFQERLGDHHPDTRRAANNLALSYLLAGDVSSALELEKENYRIRMDLFGPDHPDVWWSACNLGLYLRERGHLGAAIKMLDDAVKHVRALRPGGSDPNETRSNWHRAIAYRNAGDPDRALQDNAENLVRFQDLYGPHGRPTRSCKLSFAIDYHLAGDSATALHLAEETLTSSGKSGAHDPFAPLHRLNMAVFRRALGQLEQAAALSAETRDDLLGWLGEDHPWSIAATINHARMLALTGEPDAGRELLRAAHDDCLDFLPPDHPYTRRAAANLASDVADWGDLHVDVPL
jgi:cellulose biosynthesis protein BcsQ